MADIKKEDVIQFIENMTLLEASELVKELEQKFGVTAAPSMAMAGMVAAGAAPAQAAQEEKTEFTVNLISFGEKKIQVIKEIRAITGLGLKEAKDLVDGVPKPVKENISKEEADDIKKKDEIEAVNQADNLAYATEKSLKDYGDKVSQAERADIEVKLNDLKSAIKDKNVDRIKKCVDELTKASHKLAEEIYKQAAQKQQAGQQGAAGAAGAGPQAEGEAHRPEEGKKKEEDIIDAEYKEEDDSKK